MPRSTNALLALAVVLLLAGCGGGGGGEGAGTVPGAAGVTIEPEGAGAPGPFQSTEFDPPVSFTAPAGWRFQEDFGVIQGFRGAGERWALTLESQAGAGNIGPSIEAMRATPDFTSQDPEPVEVAGHEGQKFEGEPENALLLEGTEYFALRHSILRVWVLDVDGTQVRIFAEAGAQRKDLRDQETDAAFFSEVDQILASLEFSSPQG